MDVRRLASSFGNKKIKKVLNLLYHRIYINPALERDVVARFHKLYYDAHQFGGSWGDTAWLGVRAIKCPLDLWIYQEIVHELRPELIVETGTAHGGSALFLASVCDMVDNGRIITVDVEAYPGRPRHPRIAYLHGASTDAAILAEVRSAAAGAATVMVVLDSDHRRDHVLAELRAYADVVTPGSYLIAEDTNVNGHPVYPEHGPGPREAVEAFLAERGDFAPDRGREKFFLTFNPGGYLRKRA